MKSTFDESYFSFEIYKNLQKLLGKQYQIATSYASESIDKLGPIYGRPDIVIYNPEDQKTTFVEFKGLGAKADLPMATISTLRKIKEVNKALALNVLLVTDSRIDEALRNSLAAEHISVIPLPEGNDDIAADVARSIAAAVA